MSWVPIYLWLNGAMFVLYGAACLLSPSLPADYAGFELATPSGTVEVVAMYGGLQLGFGALVLLGARDGAMRETALWALAVVLGGLALARLYGLSMYGASEYNLGAVAYEATSAVLAVVALRGAGRREAAS